MFHSNPGCDLPPMRLTIHYVKLCIIFNTPSNNTLLELLRNETRVYIKNALYENYVDMFDNNILHLIANTNEGDLVV